jgi:hypothetical protein
VTGTFCPSCRNRCFGLPRHPVESSFCSTLKKASLMVRNGNRLEGLCYFMKTPVITEPVTANYALGHSPAEIRRFQDVLINLGEEFP